MLINFFQTPRNQFSIKELQAQKIELLRLIEYGIATF